MIVLLLMLSNVINNFDVDFIVPISKVDENMERAHKMDALITQKFWVKSLSPAQLESLELCSL
jgi:glutamate--cysteine ligase catalytic subunit